MSEQGFYGKSISTQMRKELSWQAIFLLDFFRGLWAQPRGKVWVSNKTMAKQFGWSPRTVQRALTLLEDGGYIRRHLANNCLREILPGGSIGIQEEASSATRTEGDSSVMGCDSSVIGGDSPVMGGMTDVSRGYDRPVTLKPINIKPIKLKEEDSTVPPKPEEERVDVFPQNPDTGEKELEPLFSLSKTEFKSLWTTFRNQGADARAEFYYWVWQLYIWKSTNPAKFKKIKSFPLTIQAWRRKELSNGKEFHPSGPAGPSYYPTWQIDKFSKEARNGRV